jgi:hypothetical protein
MGLHQVGSLIDMCTASQAIHQGDKGTRQPTLTRIKDTVKEADSPTTGQKDKRPEGPLESMSDYLLGITLANKCLDFQRRNLRTKTSL